MLAFFKKMQFIYLFTFGARAPRCFVQAFSSFGEQPSHCGGFSCCRAQVLGAQASAAVACGLSSWGAWALLLRGIFSA